MRPPSAPCRSGPSAQARGPSPGASFAAPVVFAVLAALAVLAGCSPTEGEDGRFDPVPTTNTDYAPAVTTQVGNKPVSMSLACDDAGTINFDCAAGTLTLVATANSFADTDPVNGAGSVSIVTNDGAGNLAEVQRLVAEPFASLALLGQLNPGTDLDPDLVVLDDNNQRVAIYFNTGNAGAPMPTTPTPTHTASGTVGQLRLADLDGDGNTDIVYSVPSRGELVALINDAGGTGAFTPYLTGTAVGDSRFVLGDFNGIGDLDLAVINGTNNTIAFWEWNGSNGFTQTVGTSSIGIDTTALYLVTADLDGDADLDIAAISATAEEGGEVLTLIGNNGSGGFGVYARVAVPAQARRLFALNADPASSAQELVVVHPERRFFSYFRGPVTGAGPTYYDTTRSVAEVIAGDVDNDGASNDMITVELVSRAVGVYLGDGAGDYTRTQIGFTTEVTFPRLADVDGDGDKDLLVLQGNSDRIAMLRWQP